jgi:hypothetical protein
MADIDDTSAALRRLEAALNRIAAHVAKPRPAPAFPDGADVTTAAHLAAAEPARHEIVTKLDDLIGGLRNALGIERPS